MMMIWSVSIQIQKRWIPKFVELTDDRHSASAGTRQDRFSQCCRDDILNIEVANQERSRNAIFSWFLSIVYGLLGGGKPITDTLENIIV